jgi:hypothetical protein
MMCIPPIGTFTSKKGATALNNLKYIKEGLLYELEKIPKSKRQPIWSTASQLWVAPSTFHLLTKERANVKHTLPLEPLLQLTEESEHMAARA